MGVRMATFAASQVIGFRWSWWETTMRSFERVFTVMPSTLGCSSVLRSDRSSIIFELKWERWRKRVEMLCCVVLATHRSID